MFDIGWPEMLVVAIIMIVVVGPKDLPKMLRTFGRTTSKLRGMAGDFQKQFNEALKEADLEDVKSSVDSLRKLNPTNEIKKSLNPFEKAANEVRAGLHGLQTPAKPADKTPSSNDSSGEGTSSSATPNKPEAPAGAATQPAQPVSAKPAGASTANGASKPKAGAAAKKTRSAKTKAPAATAKNATPSRRTAAGKKTAATARASTKKPAATRTTKKPDSAE